MDEWNETNELTTTVWMVGYMTMKKTLKVQGNVADSLRSEDVGTNLGCDGSHRGGLEKKATMWSSSRDRR